MEYTRYGDSIAMTAGGKKYRERLYNTVDTTQQGYVCTSEWTVVSPETIGSGASAKTRVRRIPQKHSINVPFILGNDAAKAVMKAFFQGITSMGLPSGVTSLQTLQQMEPFGQIDAAIDASVNIVDLPDSEGFPQLIDEDMSDAE